MKNYVKLGIRLPYVNYDLWEELPNNIYQNENGTFAKKNTLQQKVKPMSIPELVQHALYVDCAQLKAIAEQNYKYTQCSEFNCIVDYVFMHHYNCIKNRNLNPNINLKKANSLNDPTKSPLNDNLTLCVKSDYYTASKEAEEVCQRVILSEIGATYLLEKEKTITDKKEKMELAKSVIDCYSNIYNYNTAYLTKDQSKAYTKKIRCFEKELAKALKELKKQSKTEIEKI